MSSQFHLCVMCLSFRIDEMNVLAVDFSQVSSDDCYALVQKRFGHETWTPFTDASGFIFDHLYFFVACEGQFVFQNVKLIVCLKRRVQEEDAMTR